jgi:hypothetical protein
MTPEQDRQNASTAYEQACVSYHAIDDFRTKLLGLLPVATGTGVFLLLNSNTDLLGADGGGKQETLKGFLVAIGVVGSLFTLGLFAYELFGIKRCHALIETGERLEFQLAVRGQFRNRPSKLMGLVNEPLASAFIYPASLGAWVFLIVAYRTDQWRILAPVGVFGLGLASTVAIAKGIEHAAKGRFREEVHAEIEKGLPQPGRSRIPLQRVATEMHADVKDVREAAKALAEHHEITYHPDEDAVSAAVDEPPDRGERSPDAVPVVATTAQEMPRTTT